MEEQSPIQENPVPPVTTGTPPPPNYLVWAILVTIFCCFPIPLGIVSIIYAAQVNSKWYSGDLEGARQSSKNAKLWAWISFGIGLFAQIITWIFYSAIILSSVFGN